jgi:hypothetical protein
MIGERFYLVFAVFQSNFAKTKMAPKVGLEPTTDCTVLLGKFTISGNSLTDYCLKNSTANRRGYDSRCHTPSGKVETMKVPVVTLKQVKENSESEIQNAVGAVKKTVNGGLVHRYFVQKKNRTTVAHVRLKT